MTILIPPKEILHVIFEFVIFSNITYFSSIFKEEILLFLSKNKDKKIKNTQPIFDKIIKLFMKKSAAGFIKSCSSIFAAFKSFKRNSTLMSSFTNDNKCKNAMKTQTFIFSYDFYDLLMPERIKKKKNDK
jgi:hypothetical protein